mgnify:CR=1 FL=1
MADGKSRTTFLTGVPKEVSLTREQLEAKLTEHTAAWEPQEAVEFLRRLDKATLEALLPVAVSRMAARWPEDVFIDAFYRDFCGEDLEDFGAVLAGEGGFVFGRTEEGARKVARLYQTIVAKYDLVWSELARGLLAALASWQVRGDEPFFAALAGDVLARFDAAEAATFLRFWQEYERDCGTVDWSTLPAPVRTLLKRLGRGR